MRTKGPLSEVTVGIGFANAEGTRLLTYKSDFRDGVRLTIPRAGDFSIEVEIEELPLAPDIYCLDIGCRSGDFHSLDYIAAGAQIEIMAGPKTPVYISNNNAGVRLPSKWLLVRSGQNVSDDLETN